MKAPDIIYLQEPTCVRTKKSFDNDVKYVRTDAFIKKACEWLESVNLDFYQIREGVFSMQLVEDFKKYMKGE